MKESMRPGRRKVLWSIGGLFAAGAVTAAAGEQPSPPKAKKLTAGEKEAKKLLLLMDKDQNGKVSKAEFMAFMEAEFDLLDKDHSGELDVQELTQFKLRSNAAIHGR